MKTTKINIGLAISRNYDKVSLEMLDEPINHENEEDFKANIRKRFDILRGEVNFEFSKISK